MANKYFSKIFQTTFICLITLESLFAQNGTVKSYYPEGTIKSEISFVNDVLDGSAIWYYPNGNLKSEKNYSNGILYGWIKEYFDSGLLKEEYYAKNGIKDGTQRIFYENGALKELSEYSDGKQMHKSVFDYDLSYNPPQIAYQGKKNQNEVLSTGKGESLCDAEVCPTPFGGMKSIQDNLIYPEHALRYGLEGSVTLQATINIQGEVVKTQIIKSLGLGCDEAAQDAVRKTKFLPGKNHDNPVESTLTINVEFKIVNQNNSPELKGK